MKSIFYLLTLSFITIASTCKQVSLLNTTWKVLEMRMPNTTSVQMPTKEYILEFRADSSVSVKLDVNTCFSKYQIVGNNQITIHPLGCTKACCDSEFAGNLATFLSQTKNFKMKGEKLELLGAGKFRLERVP